MFVGFLFGIVLGAVAGYAFRGYISRTKSAAGKAVAADVEAEVTKAASKL
jgi:hypothetical protein